MLASLPGCKPNSTANRGCAARPPANGCQAFGLNTEHSLRKPGLLLCTRSAARHRCSDDQSLYSIGMEGCVEPQHSRVEGKITSAARRNASESEGKMSASGELASAARQMATAARPTESAELGIGSDARGIGTDWPEMTNDCLGKPSAAPGIASAWPPDAVPRPSEAISSQSARTFFSSGRFSRPSDHLSR